MNFAYRIKSKYRLTKLAIGDVRDLLANTAMCNLSNNYFNHINHHSQIILNFFRELVNPLFKSIIVSVCVPNTD